MTEHVLTRIIMHADMDAFFASIEQRDNPDLRGKPVIVGGPIGSRGVVSTCSYEARKFGVHSAMPIAQAVRLCPQGVFLPVNSSAYGTAAKQIKEIFQRFSPAVQMVSVDEGFFDVTGIVKDIDAAREYALLIKRTIRSEVGITCTIGIAPNKLIAKIGSAMEKPDGLTILFGDDIERRLYPLPANRLWGVGPVTEKFLQTKGIQTIGDLARADADWLRRELGVHGVQLAERARGVDDRAVLDDEYQPDEKSISHEHTLDKDSRDIEQLHALLLALADKVVMRMQRGGWLAGVVALRLRYADFKTITRQKALSEPTDDSRIVFQTVRGLLPVEAIVRQGVRLIGVRVSKLSQKDDTGQVELFNDPANIKTQSLDERVRQLRDKFGDDIVVKAGTKLARE
jgi:DNA polymerase IV